MKDSLMKFLFKSGINIPKSWITKYSVFGVCFFLWISFIDNHSLIDRFKLSRTINKLEKERQDYKLSIENAIVDQEILDRDKEKFAREKYYMHKQDEEVFIIETK
jgi:cell division protein FtsB